MRASLEAFENAKLRGRFLEDLQEENDRLQKELTAREEELEELQKEPVKKGWLR
jgi:Skp family chaperone for outer membrane proteins